MRVCPTGVPLIKMPQRLVVFAAVLAIMSAVSVAGRGGGDTQDPAGRATSQALTATLKQHAIRLNSLVPESGFEDLQPFRRVFKNVRIVALGEATHGTKEFFTFKHRMVEFLVREMGFTIFAIEASYPACLRLNRYVLEGKGDPAAALTAQGFWTWDTKEVAGLIEWIRRYNEGVSNDRKVSFVGFDPQHYETAVDFVSGYLELVSPEHAELVPTAAAAVATGRVAGRTAADPARAQHRGALDALLAAFALNEPSFVLRSSRAEFDEALQNARILVHAYETFSRPSRNPYEPPPTPALTREVAWQTGASQRDWFMAQNVIHVLQRSAAGAKVVLWVHNTHMAVGRHTYTGWHDYPPMGSHLRRFFGDQYYALGFVFNRGGFQARDMDKKPPENRTPIEFSVGPAAEESVEWALSQTAIPNFVVDFRPLATTPVVKHWLETPHIMKNIGGGFARSWNRQYLVPVVLSELFDGVLYVDRTTRAVPNER